MKRWAKISIGLLAAVVVLPTAWALVLDRPAAPLESAIPAAAPLPVPASVEIAPGLSVAVVGSVPAGAELLCSRCLKPYPLLLMHVISTYAEGTGRYVGSYRCNKDFPAAVLETRTRLEAAPSSEVKSFMSVARGRAPDPGRVAKLSEAGDDRAGALRVLGAIERGELILAP